MNAQKNYVYMLTDQTHSNLTVGVDPHLVKRFKNRLTSKKVNSKSKSTNVKLVYYEVFNEISSAMIRERAIQEWEFRQKIRLINTINPDWEDLASEIMK